MEIKGKIIAVMQPREGVSKTGTQWKVQEYVLEETASQYPRKVAFEVFGEEKIKNFNIQEGVEYKVSFDIDAREWNGRYFNSIRAWKVQPVQNTQSTNPVQPVEAFPPVAPATAMPDAEEGKADDLPF